MRCPKAVGRFRRKTADSTPPNSPNQPIPPTLREREKRRSLLDLRATLARLGRYVRWGEAVLAPSRSDGHEHVGRLTYRATVIGNLSRV